MNDIIYVILFCLVVAGLVSVVVIPIFLIANHIQEDNINKVINLDCNQLSVIIKESYAVKYDYAVREWISKECWK